jgi:hypothetical protein
VASLVAAEFSIPSTLETDRVSLRMLRLSDAEADYEAVMESQRRLRAGSPNGWPREGFTLAENRTDLTRHESEFDARIAFAYTVLNPVRDKVLGCLYINPSQTADADVYMWTRDSVHRTGLTTHLFDAVDGWLKSCWPFDNLNYVRTNYYLPTQPPAPA